MDKYETAWKGKIIQRDKCCQKCGSRENLQAHHIIGRKYKSTMYDLRNGITLCSYCHSNFAHTRSVKGDNEFREWLYRWFLRIHSEKDWLNIHRLKHTIKKWNKFELEELIKSWE